MDIETVYLFVGVLVISSFVLVVLQRLFKNKSYEEVLAEQRQHTNALFGNQAKPKVKDKKQKKALKKSKEKKAPAEAPEDVGDEATDRTDPVEESTKDEVDQAPAVKSDVAKTNHHSHVEFKEATTLVEEPPKRKPRRESAKAILAHRDSSSELTAADVVGAPHANHFEETHPKDECELASAQQAKEEKNSGENKRKKQAADKKIKHQVNEIISKKEREKVDAGQQQQQKEKVEPTAAAAETKEIREQIAAAVVVQNGLAAVPVKDKKKKKSELNALAQNHEKAALHVNLPQIIALVGKADMSKQDVQTLIDALLNKQHDAPSIVDEWSEGRGDPMQKLKKQLAEKTQHVAELLDSLTGAQSKLREVRADQQSERAQLMAAARDYQEKCNALQHEKLAFDKQIVTLTIQCQQMQEETGKSHKLVDELKALQMQHQRYVQQMEGNVENLKYEITNKQMQINKQMQYQSELEKGLNEMQLKCDNLIASDRQQYSNELEMWKEKMQSLEMKLGQDCQALQQQLEEAKAEIGKANSDARIAQENNAMLVREKDKEIAKHAALNNNALQENVKLKEELQKVHEAKTNGSIEQGKQHQMLINQLNTELKNVKNQLENSTASNQQQSLELEELKNKNNELRKKNWKVMEALNAAECRAQSSPNAQKQANDDKLNAQLAATAAAEDPKVARTKLLERVFPSIAAISADLPDDQWDVAVRDAVRDHVAASIAPVPLPAPDVEASKDGGEGDDAELVKLRAENANYRKIIDQSEAILCKLQTHVEEEQIRWSKELKSRDDSISRLSSELELKDEELRQKTESLNQAITINSHSTNGPAAGFESDAPDVPQASCLPHSVSTDSSAASSVADQSEKKKKKRKKKKESAVGDN